MRVHLIVPVVLATYITGCITATPPPEGWLETLASAPPASRENAFPMPPAELEPLMRAAEFEIRSAEGTTTGVSGAMKIDAYYPAIDRTLVLKWKPAPEGGMGWNNTPRREIAAYQIQKWFLEPSDYVVPTTVAVCIPLAAYAVVEEAGPNFPGIDCIVGTQAIWLEDVTADDELLETERFYREANYARHLANYNLVTYLIDNRDTRTSNYLVSKDDTNRRVYAVDNGITFGEWFYNFFRPHWNKIRVPSLPRDSIDRLRRVTAEDFDALTVVAELHRDANGILRETAPSTAFEADVGARMRDGVLQFGLRPDEIDEVRERLRTLLKAVEEGEIPVF